MSHWAILKNYIISFSKIIKIVPTMHLLYGEHSNGTPDKNSSISSGTWRTMNPNGGLHSAMKQLQIKTAQSKTGKRALTYLWEVGLNTSSYLIISPPIE